MKVSVKLELQLPHAPKWISVKSDSVQDMGYIDIANLTEREAAEYAEALRAQFINEARLQRALKKK